MSDEYRLTTTAPTVRPADPSVQRYDPWLLGLYVTAALGLPAAGFGLGWLVWEWRGLLIGFLLLPVSMFLLMWSWDAWQVEHARLQAERRTLQPPPALEDDWPTPEPAMPAAPEHLRLGLLVNGQWTAPADALHPNLLALRAKCLRLVRAGLPAQNWSRSALAEGDGAVMPGADWDEASAELQHHDLFYVKPGRGGGLRPHPERDAADIIKRLEVAR